VHSIKSHRTTSAARTALAAFQAFVLIYVTLACHLYFNPAELAGWTSRCCVLSPEPHAVHVSARGFMVHGCRGAAQLCCLLCCTPPALRPTLQRDGAEAAHQEQRGHGASADEPNHFLRAVHTHAAEDD
jgi:hypothetical protein